MPRWVALLGALAWLAPAYSAAQASEQSSASGPVAPPEGRGQGDAHLGSPRQNPNLLPELQRRALGDALLASYQNVDHLSLVGALRSAITGVFESYCALSNLLPDDNGYDPWTLTLGIGCLVGASTLFYLTGRRIHEFAARPEAHGRWIRFEGARAQLTRPQAEVYAAELEDAADGDAVRRWVDFGLAVASLVAAGTLLALAAEGTIDDASGIAIGGGAVIVGVVSLVGWLTEGPDERAWNQYSRDSYSLRRNP